MLQVFIGLVILVLLVFFFVMALPISEDDLG